ncbi:MAG: hypothetical protein ACLRMZ_00440 [Blautia marasmi]
MDSTVENIIASCAEGLVSAQISSYDSTTGILSFNTSAGDVGRSASLSRCLWKRRSLRLWITPDTHRIRMGTLDESELHNGSGAAGGNENDT